MEQNKEYALFDTMEEISRSWTWEKLTEAERTRFFLLVNNGKTSAFRLALKGSYRDRWIYVMSVYEAFLAGLGYSGGLWREGREAS